MRSWIWLVVALAGCGPTAVGVPRVDPGAQGLSEDVVDRVDALCRAGSEAMCGFLQPVLDAQSAYLQADVGCRARGEAASCAAYGRLGGEFGTLNQRLADAQAGRVAPEAVVAASGPRLGQVVATSGAL